MLPQGNNSIIVTVFLWVCVCSSTRGLLYFPAGKSRGIYSGHVLSPSLTDFFLGKNVSVVAVSMNRLFMLQNCSWAFRISDLENGGIFGAVIVLIAVVYIRKVLLLFSATTQVKARPIQSLFMTSWGAGIFIFRENSLKWVHKEYFPLRT